MDLLRLCLLPSTRNPVVLYENGSSVYIVFFTYSCTVTNIMVLGIIPNFFSISFCYFCVFWHCLTSAPLQPTSQWDSCLLGQIRRTNPSFTLSLLGLQKSPLPLGLTDQDPSYLLSLTLGFPFRRV